MAFTWESSARSYSKSIPNIFKRADGHYMYDEQDKAYLDFLCGAGTLLLGHNHPNIQAAIANVSDPLMNHLDLRTSAESDFVQTLLPVLPFKNKDEVCLHFCGPAGGDAVEAALKLAALKTGRKGIFAFHGSYHGMSQGALSVTSNNKARAAGLSAKNEVTFLSFPYPYRMPEGFNTEDTATDFCLAQLKLLLEDDHSGTALPGAILIEPVQGEGGTIPAPKRFIQELRKICDEHGIILIFDEIQSGLGRCGTWFCAEAYGVSPDIVTISKGIGGGFPMALIAFHKDLNCWEPGNHIGTFRGQQYAMAAGKALLETIRDEKLTENATKQGSYLVEQLQKIQDANPDIIGEVRGRGLYIGVEVNKDVSDSGALSHQIQQAMLSRNIVMERGGRQSSVLRILSPLTITQDICDIFLNSFEESVKEVSETNLERKTA